MVDLTDAQERRDDLPSISVVIPTYNRRDKIERAISSVLAQTGQGKEYELTEIIVVDDGSSDDTQAVVEGLQSDLIRYHRLSQNGGAGRARNEGVKLAKAEWIAFQDSDDFWMENKLSRQVWYIGKNSDVGICCTGFRSQLSGDRYIDLCLQSVNEPVTVLSEKNFVDAPTIMIRKKIYEKLGGFDESLRALEDWDLALRACGEGRVLFVPEILVHADLSGSGVSSNAGNYYDARCRIIAKNRELLQHHDCLEGAMKALLESAKQDRMLETVGRMLELHMNRADSRIATVELQCDESAR